MKKTITLTIVSIKEFVRNWRSIILLLILPLLLIGSFFISFSAEGLQELPVGVITNSNIELNGLNNIGSAIGNASKIKGINGSLVCLVSYDKNGIALDWVTGKIGENGLKENVWYEVKNGKFSEVK